MQLIPNGVVVESEGQRIEIDLRDVAEVWKETLVAPGALELGDRLYVNGTAGVPFKARYVWANIAQLDGVVRAVDATGIDLELRPHGVIERIEFSQYVQFGSADGSVRFARSDLVVGRQVGLVVYRPRDGLPARATRIW